MLHDDINRRDFFRLEDRVHLIKRPIEKHLISEDPYNEKFCIPKEALLFSQLRALESDAQSLMPLIADTNNAVATYLKTIDQKIDCITRYLVSDSKGENIAKKENVSLSEGGISFVHHAPLELDSYIHITMVLFPSYSSISTIGQVKGSCVLEGLPTIYRIGVEFTVLLENDQKQLSRHIRRKQSLELREHSPKSGENR
ncbi:hypothetical protein A9Q81_04555 [Gammaproteobacteria bacterium 42_54_T18]|nr:hypothetical protein A9Q81_04555 [Gammaproteobacteria bacterium 42_54_T18]